MQPPAPRDRHDSSGRRGCRYPPRGRCETRFPGPTMSQTHSHTADEYLMTIWLLAYPVGEYVPSRRGPQPTAAARIADQLHVSRASAGEMLKRLEAEGMVVRGE